VNDYRQISTDLVIKCLPFEQLDRHTLYDMLSLRMSVFCVEQNCPYQDADGRDQAAWHVLAFASGSLVGTTRILMPSVAYPDACSIGRVANDSAYRGRGIGQELVRHAVDQCERMFPTFPIRIGAQKYLTKFYAQFGFVEFDQPYLEDGIVHVKMEKPPVVNA